MIFDIEVVESLPSTQDEVRERLASGRACPHALIALDQTKGRGRRKRVWISEPGASLAMSVTLPEWRGHPRPWLPGMAAAAAVAEALGAQLQWPNDVILGGRKLAGILVEQVPLPDGTLQPVVGVGVNLRQTAFPPEISHRATSLLREKNLDLEPATAARLILQAWEPLRGAMTWEEVRPLWEVRDSTAGKVYRLANGQAALGVGIGPQGELRARIEGREKLILAAEAFFDSAEEE